MNPPIVPVPRPEARPHQVDRQEAFLRACRLLLEEARALGLQLDDVIAATRDASSPSQPSN